MLQKCLKHVYLVPQPGPTLCDHLDGSPPGSSVDRIFFRQKYWSGLLFPPPGSLPDLGIKPASPVSPALQADSLPAEQKHVASCYQIGKCRYRTSPSL